MAVFSDEAYRLAMVGAELMPSERGLFNDLRQLADVAFALLTECQAKLRAAELDYQRSIEAKLRSE